MPAGKVMSLRVGLYDAFTVGGVKPVHSFGSSGLPMRSMLRWYAPRREGRIVCAYEARGTVGALKLKCSSTNAFVSPGAAASMRCQRRRAFQSSTGMSVTSWLTDLM